MVHLFSSLLADAKKTIYDDEFGEIQIKKTRGSVVSLKPKTDGSLVASVPYFVPTREVRKLLESNRERLRESQSKITKGKSYSDGDSVGKSHRLRITIGDSESIKLKGLDIIVSLRSDTVPSLKNQLVRDGVAKALRKEAKAYLPRRLSYLASQAGYRYENLRFTHAKSRWGSCSSSGTISLNIMLMTLPNELIDYVLLHELTHTVHMNHSANFWSSLERFCANPKQKRRQIKDYSPYL